MTVWVVVMLDGRPALAPIRMSRRRVLAAGGGGLLAALAGLLDPDELERVEAALAAPGRADLAMAGHLEALLAHYRGLDDQVGSQRLLLPVRSSLGLVEHLRADARPSLRQALGALSAQYEQLAGWLWADSGDHARAERAYDRALTRAAEAGDGALAAYVVACKSEQALQRGWAERALGYAQAAQSSQERLTPAVRAYAVMKEARPWALDGKANRCKRRLDEAAVFLADSTAGRRVEEPPWIYFLVEKDLAGHRGMCLADLGESSAAIEVFNQVIPELPPDRVRDRAYYLSWAVKAHIGNKDPEQAAAVARETAHIAIQTGSGEVIQKLCNLHTDLRSAGKDVRAVHDLGELLRSARGPG